MIRTFRRMVTKAKKEPYAAAGLRISMGKSTDCFPQGLCSGNFRNTSTFGMVVVTGTVNRPRRDVNPESLAKKWRSSQSSGTVRQALVWSV